MHEAQARGYADATDTYADEREQMRSVIMAPGVLAAIRGKLEVPDQDEFVAWILSAVQPAPVASPGSAMTEDFISMVAERVAERLRPAYAPPVLQPFTPPTLSPAPPRYGPQPGTVDLQALTPLQRALVHAMLPGR